MDGEATTASDLLESLLGRQIETVTGRPNTILRLEGDEVIVATGRSPAGQPIPISWLENGLRRLLKEGEVEISVPSLDHRSSFVGAVLLQVPGAVLVRSAPPRVRLMDAASAYRLSEAGQVNAWWEGDLEQRFWLEITDRSDIGVDLHSPQRDAAGNKTPGYSLIWWVDVGDMVFHYDKNERAIVSWSRAVGGVSEAPTVWLSHRGATRRRLQVARAQPGWWLDLEGPYPLDEPITLTRLREQTEDIRGVLEQLQATHAGSLYFPFFFWDGSELRPMQPYLNKLPAELVALFPELVEAVKAGRALSAETPPRLGTVALGADYREARVSTAPATRDPFTVDPALVERGLKGHAETQNELARVLRDAGLEPRSRLPHEPNFDLAWEKAGVVFVAEVKSITDRNEEGQLRLGLGQVLRYRHRLEALGHKKVIPVLIPERTPRDLSWRDLCADIGVAVVSGEEVEKAPGLVLEDFATR